MSSKAGPHSPQLPALPGVGERLSAWTVTDERQAYVQPDAVFARDDHGRPVLLVFGNEVDLEREAHALRTVARKLVAPEVIALDRDERFGCYLVLHDSVGSHEAASDPEAESDPARVHAALRAVLEIARTLEQAGFSWQPHAHDVVVEDAGLAVRRLRGAARLRPLERLDARHVLETIGDALVRAALDLPIDLLRIVQPRGERLEADTRTLEAVDAELAAAAIALTRPRHDPNERMAACTDIGLERETNEDAVLTAERNDALIAVVCDGVSASRDAELAAGIAVETTLARLIAGDAGMGSDVQAMEDALRAAHAAICAAHEKRGGEPFGTTAIAAHVRGRQMTIGWVGDSRAYFLGDSGAHLLTNDHSWLNDALASGAPYEEVADSPHAHALTRCLGPLEGGDAWHAEPEVIAFEIDATGVLILCTDGLWNYAPTPEELAEVAAPIDSSCSEIARRLVAAALARGGQDNVTVAVIAISPR